MTETNRQTELGLDDRIDIACDRFEASWDSGQPISIEVLLKEFEEAERGDAARELLLVELDLRRTRDEHPQVAEYLARLPEHSDVVSAVFDPGEPNRDVGESTIAEPAGGDLPSTQSMPKTIDVATPDCRIGRYRVVERIDRGGQATVYRAIHPELGRDVVIKFCHVEKTSEPGMQEALREEGRVLARLKHPNLAQVFDFDFHDNRAYLVMEYVRGRNLAQFKRQSSPDPETWIPIVRQIAEALHYVHQNGVHHLDIKPQNILVDENNTPRLIDFGLARTETAWDESGPDPSRLVGTLAFMAPEQARCEAESVGSRADVYGLGGVIYFLVTGRAPITGGTQQDVWRDARTGNWSRDLLDGRCSPEIRQLIESSLAPELDIRLPSAGVLAERLSTLEKKPLPWGFVAACVLGICLIVILMAVVWPNGNGASSPSSTQSEIEHAKIASAGEMKIWVGPAHTDGLVHLEDVGSVREDDEVAVRATIPAGVHVSVFLFDTSGKLQLVHEELPSEDKYSLQYPRDGRPVQMNGDVGTEFFLLCGNTSGPVAMDELAGLGPFAEAWPPLPEDAVIQLRTEEVKVVQRGRGIKRIADEIDPSQRVVDYLNELRLKLEDSVDFVEGMAFAHVE